MKVRLTLDVDAAARYVIARYFGVAATAQKDRVRGRATRTQVKRFAQAALRTAVQEHAANLLRRQRATATRLATGTDVPEALAPPAEQQRTLAWER